MLSRLKVILVCAILTFLVFAGYVQAEKLTPQQKKSSVYRQKASVYCANAEIDYVTCSKKNLGMSTCSSYSAKEQLFTALLAGGIGGNYVYFAESKKDAQRGCALMLFAACEEYIALQKHFFGKPICIKLTQEE